MSSPLNSPFSSDDEKENSDVGSVDDRHRGAIDDVRGRGVGQQQQQESPPSTPPPVVHRRDDDDDGNDNRVRGGPMEGENNNENGIPSTPSGQSIFSELGQTPSTPPLSPIAGLEENNDSPAGGGRGGGLGPTQPDEEDEDDDNNNDNHSAGGHSNSNNNAAEDGVGGGSGGDDWYDNLGDDTAGVTTVARGTNVDLRVAADTFRDFIREFHPNENKNNDDDDSDDDDSDIMEEDEEEDAEPFYLKKLQEMLHITTQTSLDIDTMDLFFHNEACQRLYHQLVHYPQELIPLMDIVVGKELRRLMQEEGRRGSSDDDDLDDDHADDGGLMAPIPTVQVRPFNLKEVSNLRQLDPVAMDSLVCLKGMIVRCSPVIPDLKVAHFVCSGCGNNFPVSIDRGRINEPSQCSNTTCNAKGKFYINHQRSMFADKQLVRLQETPDQVPAGQTPASVTTFCFDDLVDKCQPGDRVEVTGVLRAQPVRVNPRMTKLKSIYKTYVDIIHFRPINGMDNSKGKAAGASRLSDQRIEQLKELSRKPDIYDRLTKSVAPSIWRLEDVKKGILCMLFGGNSRQGKSQNEGIDGWNSDDDDDESSNYLEEVNSSKPKKRGDVNILLCGDPGTSKSQLLSFVHKLSSRGIYTSGKGSSAVGLTASVVRDPETRDLVLESGALVLSDKGICCIDEFDKMTDTTRSILHEAMEQQTVSIAKAGIIASLNARTSILASANPSESRYNPNLSVVDNIKLPPTLLSRFDLIYLILDSPNADEDRRLAQHLVGLYYEEPIVVVPPLDTELLRDYIDYAQNHVFPVLSDEATQQLLDSYLELRNPPGSSFGANGTRTISATPRQLESLIRTSEALAKMRFSSTVTRDDAREALRLLKVATQAAATDPRTGRIDMDMISTGRTSVSRESEENLFSDIKEFLVQRRGNRLAVRDISQQMSQILNNTIENEELLVVLRRMASDGIIQLNERSQSVFVRTGMAL